MKDDTLKKEIQSIMEGYRTSDDGVEGTFYLDKMAALLEQQFNEDIAFYAFCYALGRLTYAVEIVVDYLLENWELIGTGTKKMIVDEINEAINKNDVGMDIDIKYWEKLLKIYET